MIERARGISGSAYAGHDRFGNLIHIVNILYPIKKSYWRLPGVIAQCRVLPSGKESFCIKHFSPRGARHSRHYNIAGGSPRVVGQASKAGDASRCHVIKMARIKEYISMAHRPARVQWPESVKCQFSRHP